MIYHEGHEEHEERKEERDLVGGKKPILTPALLLFFSPGSIWRTNAKPPLPLSIPFPSFVLFVCFVVSHSLHSNATTSEDTGNGI